MKLPVVHYYKSNNGKYKKYEGFMENDKKEGLWTFYYETPPEEAFWFNSSMIERKKKIETYKNGKKHGKCTEWYDANGYYKKKTEMFYKDGKLDGLYTKWSSMHTPKKIKQDKIEEGNYKNGKLHGLWMWWDNGWKKSSITYNNGEIISKKLFGIYKLDNPWMSDILSILVYLLIIYYIIFFKNN